MEELITPALRVDEAKALSPEEFQRLLYEYFEDKGILSDLRAHLRTHMIRVLRDTTLGKTLINKKRDASPKLQALNLLIAEYLLHRDYHYSLSVFSTEVPLTNVFPNYLGDLTASDQIVNFRFSETDMWDILETLGFMQSSDDGRNISSVYRAGAKDSLLGCIIKTCNLRHEQNLSCRMLLYRKSDTDIDGFVDILRESGMDAGVILKIVEQLRAVLKTEIERLKSSKDEEVAGIRRKLEEESGRKLERYKRKLNATEQTFADERKRLEVELDKAKQTLKECARSLQHKHKELDDVERGLKAKERQLFGKEEALSEKEKVLQRQMEEAIVEKMNYQRLISERDVSVADKGQQTLDSLSLENALLKQNLHHVQLQVNELREQNVSNVQRMQEMAVRTTTLVRELESSQRRVHELNTLQEQRTVQVAPVVPLLANRIQFGISSYSGAGEEGSTVPKLSPRQFRHVDLFRDKKSHSSRRKSESSSDEPSPTDAVLKEARLRLQNLEKESDQIDRHFREYAEKHKRPKTAAASETPSAILHDFQLNLNNIRSSLSRIFGRREDDRPQTPPEDNVEKIIKIKNLIAELPVNVEGEDYEEVITSLQMKAPDDVSDCSSVRLDTSISSVAISPDYKSEGEKPADEGRRPVWPSIGLSCMAVFLLEMFLF